MISKKLMSPDTIREIDEFIPLAKEIVREEIATGKTGKNQDAIRYHFHMNQLTIKAGLRHGTIKENYVDN